METGCVEFSLPADDAQIQLAAAALFRGVVFIDHALDTALRIAAGTLQILVRVGEFVFDQFLAAFGEVELLREIFLLVFLGVRQKFGEARNVRIQFRASSFSLVEMRSRMALISGVDGTGCEVARYSAAANAKSTS